MEREGLIDSTSLVIRRTQSEPNGPELPKCEPTFLPSDSSMLTQPSTSINCQLDIKLENSASEEIHLENSSFPVSGTMSERSTFDDSSEQAGNFFAASSPSLMSFSHSSSQQPGGQDSSTRTNQVSVNPTVYTPQNSSQTLNIASAKSSGSRHKSYTTCDEWVWGVSPRFPVSPEPGPLSSASSLNDPILRSFASHTPAALTTAIRQTAGLNTPSSSSSSTETTKPDEMDPYEEEPNLGEGDEQLRTPATSDTSGEADIIFVLDQVYGDQVHSIPSREALLGLRLQLRSASITSFDEDIDALLLSDNSGGTRSSSRIVRYQLDTKPENSTLEETHSEISTFRPPEWEESTVGFTLANNEDDDNNDDRGEDDGEYHHPIVADYLSRVGDVDKLQKRYWDLIDKQKSFLDETEVRASDGLILPSEDQEWLEYFSVSKQILLSELQEVAAGVDELGSQCLALGLIDSYDYVSSEEIMAQTGPLMWAPVQRHAPDENFYDTVDNHAVISQWLSPSSTTRTPPPNTFNYRRKAVRVLLNGKECIACPDSGSDRDIMSEVFAEQHGFIIRRTETDKEWFKMGNGKACHSIGRVRVSCTLLEESELEWRWFYVLAKCAIPLIVGMSFTQQAGIFTSQKHLLTDYPSDFMLMPTLKLIGSPQSWISFAVDGRFLVGCADTGSDLDFISFHCATEKGFEIDTRESARTCVMLPDCTIVETLGIVHATSFEIAVFDGSRMTYRVLPGLPNGLCEDLEMDFHVLPDMPCDVIFGEEFLELKDAFNTCSQIIHSKDPSSQKSLMIPPGGAWSFEILCPFFLR